MLIIASIPDYKLYDKIYPLKLAFSNYEFYVLRRERSLAFTDLISLSLPHNIANKPIFSTIFLLLKGILKLPKLKPNIIISFFFVPHGILGIIFSKLFRIKVITALMGSDQLYLEAGLFAPILNKIIKKSDAIVVPGNNSKLRLSKIIGNKIKTHVIFNSKRIESNYTPIKSKKIDLIYVGNLVPIKQVHIIIEAFVKSCQQLKKAKQKLPKLYIVGKGPLLNDLKHIITENNLTENVIFTGFQRNVNKFLRKSKFIVLSSKNEGLPAMIIEGMMNGCIPISTNVGDISDLITDRNGFLIDYNKDISEADLINNFTKVFLDVLNMDINNLEQLSKQNREYVQNFDYKNSAKLWRKLFNEIF